MIIPLLCKIIIGIMIPPVMMVGNNSNIGDIHYTIDGYNSSIPSIIIPKLTGYIISLVQ